MSHDDFQDPYQDPTLAAYLSNVIDWHGYIRFLGLPHLRDNPDIRIDRLYVEPRLAERHISPDSDPDEWPDTRTLCNQALHDPWIGAEGSHTIRFCDEVDPCLATGVDDGLGVVEDAER